MENSNFTQRPSDDVDKGSHLTTSSEDRVENSNFTQRPSDDVDKGSHRNLYCSVLSGVLIAVGVYRLTSDVWTASILGVGIWWVVYTISVGMISIVNSVDAMKKTQLEIVELLKETKRDRENHR